MNSKDKYSPKQEEVSPGKKKGPPLKDRKVFREFSERLNLTLNDLGWPLHGRQSRLAHEFGISQVAARKWLNGLALPETEKIPLLSERLNVSLEWLLLGRGTLKGDRIFVHVPVISWEEIRKWLDPLTRKTIIPGGVVPFFENTGPHSFAIPMRGTSMEPAILDQEIIVIDPDRPAKNRDLALVSEGPNTETVRRVLYDGGKTYLEVLNRDYPARILSMGRHTRILGIVLGKIRAF